MANSFFNKRLYNTLSVHNQVNNKHYSPANAEWTNSIYTYNEKNTSDIPFKGDKIYGILRSFFNLRRASRRYHLKNNLRYRISHRRKYLNLFKKRNRKNVRKNTSRKLASTKRLFISKPLIKQTSDKTIITIYTFDRYYQWSEKKSFFAVKYFKDKFISLKENSFLKKGLLKGKLNRSNNKFISDYLKNTNVFSNKQILFKRWTHKNKTVNKSRINHKYMPKYIVPSIFRKRVVIKELFIFFFIKWVYKNNLKLYINISNKKINVFKKYNNIAILSINKPCELSELNIILFRFLVYYMNKVVKNKPTNSTVINLFNRYHKLKNKKYIIKYLKKEALIIKYLIRMRYNKFKINNNISNIKCFLADIYNNSIQFNIVNLKYLHLNNDILLETMSIKLKKRKARLFRIMRKALNLVTIPKAFSVVLDKDKNALKETKLVDLNVVFTNMFHLNEKSERNSILNIESNILNNIKYKWISGIWLEAKGRLTKRFTASRSIYKYITKGNLKNLDVIYGNDFKYNSPSLYMIRNQFKPNIQYSYTFSKKRIGTFGLKGWINTV